MSKERAQRTVRFAFTSTLARLVGMGCALFQVRLVAGALTPDEFGVWSLTTGLLIFSTFLDFGISLGMQNRLSSAMASGDVEKTRAIMVSGSMILISMAGFAMLSALFLAWCDRLDILFGELTSSTAQLAPYALALGLLVVVFNLVSAPAVRYITASDKNYILPVGVYAHLNAEFIIILSVSHLLMMPIVIILISCKGMAVNSDCISRALIKVIFTDGAQLSVPQICSALFSNLPQFVMAHTVGLVAVGQLAFYMKYAAAGSGVVMAGMSALWPSYANAKASNDFEWISRTYIRSLLVALIAGVVILFITIFFGSELFALLYGAASPNPSRLSLGLCGALILSNIIGCALGAYLNGNSLYRAGLITASANAFLLLPLLFFTIPRFGVNGALGALFLAHWTIVFLAVAWSLFRIRKNCNTIYNIPLA
jgi:O-antigen/teichoic acid export membrane protein